MESWARYFLAVGTAEGVVEAKGLREMNIDMLEQVHIIAEQVLAVLRHIKVDTFLGTDEIFLMILWEYRVDIAGALAEMFASSFSMGKVSRQTSWGMVAQW